MTISAFKEERADDMFERNFELYRDLSVALQDRITFLKAGGSDPTCKATLVALTDHRRALQSVLDAEARLVKRNRCSTDGGGGELDLAAARAEIVARLARWSAER